MHRTCLLLVASVAALACAGAASAYAWPVRPFDRPHAIRGSFGDPRTVFQDSLFQDGINGPGSFSFHNGIDIAAPNGTAVYPVVGGIVHLIDAAAVSVETLDGRTFQYYHLIPEVVDGQQVIGRLSVLGTVQSPYEHVHLAEIDGFRITNPLLKGHLAPYVDRTTPRVDDILFRASDERELGPLGLCGHVQLLAAASDRPALPVPGSFAGLPVAPATVSWQIVKLGKGVVVQWAVAADFSTTLPPPAQFWNTYARGTYQNAPRFGAQQFNAMPGKFLFVLHPALDTKALGNGVYIVTVRASDSRGNTGALSQRFSVFNPAAGCPNAAPLPPVSPSPPSTTPSDPNEPPAGR
jgi:hypothetical protein